jgi:hypothetical protein
MALQRKEAKSYKRLEGTESESRLFKRRFLLSYGDWQSMILPF